MKKFLHHYFLAMLCLLISTLSLLASSHREAPLIANDPLADNVDLYCFRSPDNPDMATIIATYIPLQAPHGGPNYYNFGEHVRYEIHIDNDASIPGDEITYRFTFHQENEDPTTFFNIRLGAMNLKTTYTMEKSTDGGTTWITVIENGTVTPPNVGKRSIESGIGLGTTYEDLIANAITTTSFGEQVFVGHADDPFFVDLGGIFDLGNAPRQDGQPKDGLSCMNVSAIAIQVPISALVKASAPAQPTSILDSDYVIGVWASASRPAMLTFGGGTISGSDNYVQVSRLGMPLTNEAVIPIGMKDYWNSITPYDELSETDLDGFFYNPELALYMDDDLFGAAVPAFSALRIQRNSLGAFDFGNGQDGLFALKGSAAVAGTALDDAIAGNLLLPGPAQPRAVDLWPTFHTGVPNLRPYQLATGKNGDPLAAGKPFINNFLPNGGDMLRINLAVPPTPRTDPKFSSLGLIQAAVLGLIDPAYNGSSELEFIPNMDGFPNGRRLEDDVTRIELQAVSGVVLAAIGLWYDDFDGQNPVSQDLLDVLGFTTGVETNDAAFKSSFPYLATPWAGDGPCGYGNDNSTRLADLSLTISAPANYTIYETIDYTITVKNDGPATATGVSVAAGLPEGFVFSGASSSQGNYGLFFEKWEVGTLAAGQSASLNLTLFALIDDPSVGNFVQVFSSDQQDIDSTPGNDTDNIVDEDDEAIAIVSYTNEDLLETNGNLRMGKVYPVPAVEQVYLELESEESLSSSIQVFNASGELLKEQKVIINQGYNHLEVNIKNLAAGIYILSIPSGKEQLIQRKFIVGGN